MDATTATDSLEKRLAAAESRLAEAEAKLPAGMKHCTILFRECEKGHGWLTATNWVEFPCPTCRLAEAERVLREIAEGQHSEGARRLARAALAPEVPHD